MTIEQLRRAYLAQPFQPFEICLTDGQRITVASPEFLAFMPRPSRTFFVATGPEEFKIVDLLLVTSLNFTNRKARLRRKGNGQG